MSSFEFTQRGTHMDDGKITEDEIWLPQCRFTAKIGQGQLQLCDQYVKFQLQIYCTVYTVLPELSGVSTQRTQHNEYK